MTLSKEQQQQQQWGWFYSPFALFKASQLLFVYPFNYYLFVSLYEVFNSLIQILASNTFFSQDKQLKAAHNFLSHCRYHVRICNLDVDLDKAGAKFN